MREGKSFFALLGAVVVSLAIVPASAGAVTFNAATNYSMGTGSDPEDLAIGDFQNDDTQDIAVTAAPIGDTSYVVSWLGNGEGAFGGQFGWTTGPTDSYTVAVATGDLNGDGFDDFVSGNQNAPTPPTFSTNFWVHLSDGDGTFTSFDTAAMGQSVGDLALGSFNAGTVPDVAAANPLADTVSVALGTGTGAFPNGTQHNVGDNPTGVAIGEFNGDGNADLVSANRGSDNVSVLLGNGSGGFGAATSFGAGDGASDVQVGLFNADAFADLAVSNSNGDNVSILLGTGTGTFGTATNYAAGDGPSGIEIGDFDNDADKDLAVSNFNGSNVSVLIGTGTGTFGAPSNFSVASGPRSVVIGDFDENGLDDFATANLNADNFSVRLQEGVPKITTSATANAAIGGTITDSATLTLGSNPTGSITFTLYGPGDTTCTGTPVYTSSPVTVSGNGTYNNPTPYTPTALGTYRWIASYSGDSGNTPAAGACNDANENSVVGQATPSLSTNATNATIGNSISDSATLGGGHNLTGTITFRAYAPGDTTCSNAPAYTSNAVTVSGAGSYGNAPAFTPSTPGAYRWTASYSGDANNNAVAGACNDANETSTVSKATPGISTSATASATIGESITDSATLTGGHNMTGTVTFFAYAEDTCQNVVFSSSAVTVSGPGTYNSTPAFTPTAPDTYYWIALYSGDANNNQVQGNCNDANESSTVAKETPTLSTAATTSVNIGASISDTATLAGGSSPTGTITFTAYGPNDADCSGTAAFTDTETVSGNGDYTTDPAFTPTAAGTYRWIASYSGDANNEEAEGECNDTGETSTVNKFVPTLSTQATASANLGGSISDTATLAGGDTPGGTITFRAYGPNDATCATAVYTSDPVFVSGAGEYGNTPAFTPAQAGTYRWRAFYSGDAENEAVSGACNDPGETSTVIGPNPPPPSNTFTIGALQGRALTVNLSSAGTVSVAANKQLKPSSATGGPGAVKITLVLKKKASKQFKKKGKLKLSPVLTFTPDGGTAASQTAKRTLKKKKRK